MKPEGYRDTSTPPRSRLTSTISTPTKGRVKRDLPVPEKALNRPHDHHPPLQTRYQVQKPILIWMVSSDPNPLGREVLQMNSILRWRCGTIPLLPTVPKQLLSTPPALLSNLQHLPPVRGRIRICGTLWTSCKLRQHQMRTLSLRRNCPRLYTMTTGTVCTLRLELNELYTQYFKLGGKRSCTRLYNTEK